MIAWVAKRHFDNINLKNLISYKFLSNEEYETLRNGRNLLFAIRFGLHMIAKRREDRLLFDYQKNIAEQYILYSRLMDYWKSKFKDDIFDANYEKIINSPEQEVKKIISFF